MQFFSLSITIRPLNSARAAQESRKKRFSSSIDINISMMEAKTKPLRGVGWQFIWRPRSLLLLFLHIFFYFLPLNSQRHRNQFAILSIVLHSTLSTINFNRNRFHPGTYQYTNGTEKIFISRHFIESMCDNTKS